MTIPALDNPNGTTTSPRRSIAILGADALIAAEPATPVQLAHACLRAGFHSVVPASWGDELIAAAVLRGLSEHKDAPAIQCTCPMVMRRLLSAGSDLRPFLISLVAPPVAAARYLRAVSADSLRITYVGRCPGAADDDIDARITPEELLATLHDRGISIIDQPLVFDSVLPNDRRRYRSQAGGVPAPQALWTEGGERTLLEIDGTDMPAELAQALLSGRDVLIDCTPAIGCHCRGTNPSQADTFVSDARHRIAALEPPRSSSPILRDDIELELRIEIPDTAAVPDEFVLPASAAFADVQGRTDSPAPSVGADIGVAAGAFEAAAMRRRSPSQGVRAVVLTPPSSRESEPRQLPRAYVARRRLSPRGLRAVPPDDGDGVSAPSPVTVDPVAVPNDAEPSTAAPAASAAAAVSPAPAAATGSPSMLGTGLHPHVAMAMIVALAAVVLLSTILGVIIGRWMSR